MAKKEEGISEKAVHTKGPWKVNEFPKDVDQSVLYVDHAGGEVCRLYGGHGEPNQADARLIAAAPELLTELEHICAEAESWHSMHHAQNLIQCDSICKAIPTMKSAIRKARGEQL